MKLTSLTPLAMKGKLLAQLTYVIYRLSRSAKAARIGRHAYFQLNYFLVEVETAQTSQNYLYSLPLNYFPLITLLQLKAVITLSVCRVVLFSIQIYSWHKTQFYVSKYYLCTLL